VVYDEDFPLNASLKIVRPKLAEKLGKLERDKAVVMI